MPVLNRDTERLGMGVFSTFPQPSTIGVIPHIVEDAAPWPAEVQAIADAFTKEDVLPDYVRKLRRFFSSYPMPPDGTVHLELPDPGHPLLRRLIPLCFATSSLYNDTNLRFSGMSARVAVPFISSLLRALDWPESRVAVDEAFARPIDPCCFDDPNAPFQPPYMVADALLLLSAPWAPQALAESEVGSHDYSSHDGSPSAVDEESCVTRSSTYSQESSHVDGPPAYTQLLSAPSFDQVEVPFICVASSATLYILMASAILQRRALGIREPVVGLALDPNSSLARIALGWYEPVHDSCVDIHVAHCSDAFLSSSDTSKPSGSKRPTREDRRARGLYDLREPLEALELALAVSSLYEFAVDVLDCAKIGLEAARMISPRDSAARWRLVDAGRDTEVHVATPGYLKLRMYDWLRAVQMAHEGAK
ncbi:hypothetical protein K523DRAFT_273988 [Schizophyllum commune Tattone D]|nr:hypothetical protein K523DRAFT_273988 [Schizophyllum commune Tattone D]